MQLQTDASPAKGIGRKFSSGGPMEKRPKICKKKYRKIILFSLFQRGGTNGKKRPKNRKKRPKNSTF